MSKELTGNEQAENQYSVYMRSDWRGVMIKHKFAMQETTISITWSHAKYTILWFMTGARPDNCDKTIYVNDVLISDTHVHVDYVKFN